MITKILKMCFAKFALVIGKRAIKNFLILNNMTLVFLVFFYITGH